MPKTVTLRLDDETYHVFTSAAQAENRSLANLIQTAALDRIHEQQFVDDYEMAEILANEDLLDRLRRGSREARLAKGRFVE
ncbi:MAG: CopG family transcriptional regulator [bacterium]|nr:CopG family transcriptional regulator [bacterium]